MTLLLFAGACFAQAPLLEVSTGTRCTATFVPATAATDVQVDCTYQGKPALTGAKISIAIVTGAQSAGNLGFTVGPDSVQIVVRRASAAVPLHIEASVNGVQLITKDIAVP